MFYGPVLPAALTPLFRQIDKRVRCNQGALIRSHRLWH